MRQSRWAELADRLRDEIADLQSRELTEEGARAAAADIWREMDEGDALSPDRVLSIVLSARGSR
jgi:hypothetical protein